jgi:hypothetical protein
MKIRKPKGYDTYTIEASYTEITAIRDGLAGGSAGAVADEVRKAIEWYLDTLPLPGETDEEHEAKEEQEDAQENTASDSELDGELADFGPEIPAEEPAPEPPEDGEISASFDTDLADLDQQLPAPSAKE